MTRRRRWTHDDANSGDGITNLITNQDLSSAYWSLSGMTSSGTTGVRETATTGAHSFGMTTGLPRPAGTGIYRHTVDLIKVGPDQRFLAVGVFSIGIGSGATVYFDILNGVMSGPSSYGGFPAPTGVITPIAGGYRCAVTCGPLAGTQSGILALNQDTTPLGTFSYTGVVTDGYTVSNLSLVQLG